MRKLKALAVFMALFVGLAGTSFAQTDDHTVTVEVATINDIVIAGNVSLTINSATAGSNPDDATGSTTYAFTTNSTGGTTKISASTSVNLSTLGTGLSLAVDATAPSGGTGAGSQTLSTTDVDVVTAIPAVADGSSALDYTLSALATTGPVASTNITVTYTITN